MRYREEANKVVVNAEASLRSLAEQALLERAYADVAHIASLADSLRELSDRANAGVEAPSPACANSAPAASRAANRRSPQRPKGTARRPRGYPRFERDGDKLVKVGWSKKAREEYEHRASLAAVLAFVRHLRSRVQAESLFAIEDLLPVPNGEGEELPSYQVYLALAWLRQAGAIDKQGRDGYLLRNGYIEEESLDKLWDALPGRDA